MSEATDREKRGQTHLDAAKDARWTATNEPYESPDLDDAVKEKAATASQGSKSKNK